MKIGGFLSLDLPDFSESFSHSESVYSCWTEDAIQILKRSNARSIFAALLKAHDCKRLWLTEFCSKSMHSLAQFLPVEYYPVNRDLSPDLTALETGLKHGDAVLGINYFGRSYATEFNLLKEKNPDVLFIEDCAQDLFPGLKWGDWQVFSPRKLLGVPDGGIGVCRSRKWQVPESYLSTVDCPEKVVSKILSLLLRYEDLQETRNEDWYTHYRNVESSLVFDGFGENETRGMSRLSGYILSSFSISSLSEKRMVNQDVYYSLLPDSMMFFPKTASKPMLGVPVWLENRDKVAAGLADMGIFCACHWDSVPDSCCAAGREISKHILTLPVDHRYTPKHMRIVAESLMDIVQENRISA